MMGGYTENLEKSQNCQNWGWALARDNTVCKSSKWKLETEMEIEKDIGEKMSS